MFFDFQGQKVLLKAEFEGTPGLLAQLGSVFLDFRARREQFEYLWVRHGLLMTKYDRLSEHLSILWQSLKVLHFLVRFLPNCPQIYCPLWWRYRFHIYIDRCKECPFVLGFHAHELQHAIQQKQ